eukprot:6490669-Amphidinium_carterae.1
MLHVPTPVSSHEGHGRQQRANQYRKIGLQLLAPGYQSFYAIALGLANVYAATDGGPHCLLLTSAQPLGSLLPWTDRRKVCESPEWQQRRTAERQTFSQETSSSLSSSVRNLGLDGPSLQSSHLPRSLRSRRRCKSSRGLSTHCLLSSCMRSR